MKKIDIFDYYQDYIDKNASRCQHCESNRLKLALVFDADKTQVHRNILHVPLLLEIECKDCGTTRKETVEVFANSRSQENISKIS